MKSILKFLIALQIALSPSLVLAQSTPPPRPEHSPLSVTDSQTIDLPNGTTYTSENTVVVAETEEEKAAAEKWFIAQVEQADHQSENLRIIGLTTEGQAETAAAKKLTTKFSPDLKISSQTIKKTVLERIQFALKNATATIKKPFSTWVEKRPGQFKKVFAVMRGGINGAFTSYVFNYFFLDGAIPTWLAWTTGLTLGAMSAGFNYYSDLYSGWLDRKADVSTQNILLKYFPFLKRAQIDELKSISKWGVLESIFLAIPILFFQYLPDLLGLGDGYSFAESWLSGIFAISMTFATGMMAQYPWDKGISRAHTSDTEHALDHLSQNWIKFRTALMYVVISALQVTTTSLSLGDFKVASYLALGTLGAAGMYYRYKTVKRTDAREASHVLQSEAKDCKSLLSQAS